MLGAGEGPGAQGRVQASSGGFRKAGSKCDPGHRTTLSQNLCHEPLRFSFSYVVAKKKKRLVLQLRKDLETLFGRSPCAEGSTDSA